jgi:sRNA-binding protein
MDAVTNSGSAPADQMPTRAQDTCRHERQSRLLTLLRQVFPETFPTPPVPLAVGIRRQIVEVACDDQFRWEDVAAVLRLWTRRQDYIAAVAHGEPRRNFDGSIAGEPKEPHRQHAMKQLAAIAPEAKP